MGLPDPDRAVRPRRRHLARSTSSSSFTEIGSLAPTLATMIGLGVGIDYSLFIVTRYRENLAGGHGRSRRPSGHSVSTAGSAVLFAGTHRRDRDLRSRHRRASRTSRGSATWRRIVVAVMMLAALTLLPAIIAVVGNDIDRWQVPSLIHHPDRAAASGSDPTSPAGSVWERWADTGRARTRGRSRSLGVAILLVLAWPVLLDAPRRVRRRQPADLDDAAPGLRPDRRGLRARHQRPAARRRAAAAGGRRRRAHRHHDRDREDAGRQPVAPAADSTRARPSARSACSPPRAPESAQTADLVQTLRGTCSRRRSARTGAQAYVGRRHGDVHRHRRPHQRPAPATSSARSCCSRSSC